MILSRAGTALLTLVVLAGCYLSAAPLVGDADLTRIPRLADGRYCLAEAGWTRPVEVDHDECRILAWNETARVYRERRDWDGADWEFAHEVAVLSDSLYIDQVFEARDDYPYTFVVIVAGDDGFAIIGDVKEDGFGAFADAYPDVEASNGDRYDAGVIEGGEPERIRALIELAVRDDIAAWIDGEGTRDNVAFYIRVDAGESALDEGLADADLAARYTAVVETLKTRFVVLRQ